MSISIPTLLFFFAEKVQFKVQIVQSSGKFDIIEGGILKCSGVVKQSNERKTMLTSEETSVFQEESLQLDKAGLYQELRLRGYDYGPHFQKVQFYDISGL